MGGFGEPKQASSRQGENKHSIPALWHSVVRSVKNSPVHVISCLRFGRPKIAHPGVVLYPVLIAFRRGVGIPELSKPVSYTHLRAHETKANLVCRLLLEKKKKKKKK